MNTSSRAFVTATLIVLAGGLLVGEVEAQKATTVDTCFQRCVGRNLSNDTCDRYCQRRFGDKRTGGPRVYGYTRRTGSCGQFHYLKAGQCVDARTNPPRSN